MALKNKTHEIEPATKQRPPRQIALNSPEHERALNPIAALQRATSAPPSALRPADILALQRTVGNRAVQRMLSSQPHALSLQSANAKERQLEEEEEPLQGKFETAPRTENTLTENRTGLPDQLKVGIENLSGLAMDDVRVHYNSSRPAQVQALAYTQGTEIHVAPGQERHLAHEAWHVVQQKQERVKPTLQAKEVAINDDQGLEREADLMGERALTLGSTDCAVIDLAGQPPGSVYQDAPGVAVQLKSKQQVTQEFDGLGIAGNFEGAFISKHVGLGKNNNFMAAEIHAKRGQNAPRVNTVIMDAQHLKEQLKAGDWVEQAGDNRWIVTTKGNVNVQDTTKSDQQMNAAPKLNLLTIDPEDETAFTVENKTVTAVKGVTAGELNLALTAFPNYPKPGKNPPFPVRKTKYREKIINHVNAQRSQEHGTQKVAWVKNHFSKIGSKDLDQTVTTADHVEAIARTAKKVTVWIRISTGEMYHYVG